QGTVHAHISHGCCGRILVVDDDPLVRRSVTRLLDAVGHQTFEAADARNAHSCLESNDVDLAVLDVALPDTSGLDLLGEIRRRHPYLGVIMLTGSDQRSVMLEAIDRGASSYLRKPVDALALEAQVSVTLQQSRRGISERSERSRLDSELASVQATLELLPQQIAERLTSAWDLRHVETGQHVRRIAHFTEILARATGVSELRSKEMGRAAMLHDIGKIMIPDAILTKPGSLTAEEFETMKAHAALGAQLLDGMAHPLIQLASSIALCHHERWDGSGYPRQLVGLECPAEARVVAVADVYDALKQPRCYKPGWDEPRVIEHFRTQSGKLYEATLVEALLDNLPALRTTEQVFRDSQSEFRAAAHTSNTAPNTLRST
ncbi:MAG TPA: HD domain-containing phosphohydrolase, partial [Polyangiaceae bacterium]